MSRPRSNSEALDALIGAASSVAAAVPHLPPLAEDVYPRIITKPGRSLGFWGVGILVASVWAITPLSYAYLGWYIYAGRHTELPYPLLFAALAYWSAVEVLFSWYYRYLAYSIQPATPPSEMPPDQLSDLFLHVLHAGLAYTAPPSVLLSPKSPMRELRTVPEGTAVNATSTARSRAGSVSGGGPGSPLRRRKLGRLDSGLGDENAEDEGFDPLFDEHGRPIALTAEDPRAIEFREQLRTWFEYAPWEEIKRDDVRTWLAWSCFNMPLEDVASEPKKARFLARTVDMLEARTGTTFPEGRTGVHVMRLTLDPIYIVSRPFIIYAISNTVNWFLQNVIYPNRGVSIVREGDMDFLIRIPPGWTPEKGVTERNCLPILYLHGLGFGLLQNHMLLHHLVGSLPTHPLVVPLAHHTAQEIFNPRFLKPWTRKELVSTVKAVCIKYKLWFPNETGRAAGGVSLLSHSNGSVHHGWILKDCPEITRRNTFVDPVVYSLWEGDLCYNFVYRPPRTGLQLLLWYFVATEVGIANYINRHFNWADNALFIEEIPHATDPTRTAWFMGGDDIVMDAKRVRRYLERNGVTTGLHWDEHAGHGDGLLGESRDRVVMYVGTGSTRGWQGWLTRGRRSHSLGQYDRPETPPSGRLTPVPAHPPRTPTKLK